MKEFHSWIKTVFSMKLSDFEVWLSLQTHKSFMAFASLKVLPAILRVKENIPEPKTNSLRNQKEISNSIREKFAFLISGEVYQVLNHWNAFDLSVFKSKKEGLKMKFFKADLHNYPVLPLCRDYSLSPRTLIRIANAKGFRLFQKLNSNLPIILKMKYFALN